MLLAGGFGVVRRLGVGGFEACGGELLEMFRGRVKVDSRARARPEDLLLEYLRTQKYQKQERRGTRALN